MTTKRYHPVLIGLHWLLAIMVLLSLFMGSRVLAETPNADPRKLELLQAHMTAGGMILVLTLIRLATRLLTPLPPPAPTGHPIGDRLARPAHWLLYTLVIAMAVSGMAMASAAGLPDMIFGESPAVLPADFSHLPERAIHGLIAPLLMLLIVLHIGAALYHHFVRRDGLLRRMWFSRD
jgi:cytochrome b561